GDLRWRGLPGGGRARGGGGWGCLGVGCGAGGVARWLADQVGGTGQVLATDLNTRFAEGHGRPNLTVQRHDIVTDPIEDGAFDLAHARAVLEHIPDRDRALRRMIGAVRPGGWLLIEDVDHGAAMTEAMARYVCPAELGPVLTRVYAAVEAAFAAAGADASYGARLPSVLKGAGLADVGAEAHIRLVAGGTDNWTRGTIEHLGPRLVAANLISAADIDQFLALTAQPAALYPPPAMAIAWGRRPPT